MDDRKILCENTEISIHGVSYVVKSVMGTGSSSIVYEMLSKINGKTYILKEFYPNGMQASRKEDNLLTFANDKRLIKSKMEKFMSNYEKIRYLNRNHKTTNFVVDLLDDSYINEKRGFAYYIESFSMGTALSYEKMAFPTLLDVLMRTVKALDAIHDDYLYIDLKPANIFWAPDAEFVKLFDFDNAIKKCELREIVQSKDRIHDIGTTSDYAAPEVIRIFLEGNVCEWRCLGDSADFYGIGIILLEYLLGLDQVNYLRAQGFKKESVYNALNECDKLEVLDPAIKRQIAEFSSVILNDVCFWRKFSDSKNDNLAEDILDRLSKIKKTAENPVYFTSSNIVLGDVFIERDEELQEIRNAFDNKGQVVCLYGQPAIGKKTLSKRFAAKYCDCYDVIINVPYEIHDGCTDNIIQWIYNRYAVKPINNGSESILEKYIIIKQYFENAKGLLIIDDLDYIKEGVIDFKSLKEIKWDIIISSKNELVRDYGKLIHVHPLKNQKNLFIQYYELFGNKYDNKFNNELISLLEYGGGNTLFVEIMARASALHEIPIDVLLKNLHNEISEADFSHEVNPVIGNSRNRLTSNEAIRIAFDVSGMSSQDKLFLYLLAILNIPRSENYILYKLKVDEDIRYKYCGTYKRLARLSWVNSRTEGEITEYYLSPLIQEIICEDLKKIFMCTENEYSNEYQKYTFSCLFEIYSLTSTSVPFHWPDRAYIPEYLKFIGKIKAHFMGSQLGKNLIHYCETSLSILNELEQMNNSILKKYNEYNNIGKEIDFGFSQIAKFVNLKKILKDNKDIVQISKFNPHNPSLKGCDIQNNDWFYAKSEDEQNEFLSNMVNVEPKQYKVLIEAKPLLFYAPGNIGHYVCKYKSINVPVINIHYEAPFVKWNVDARLSYGTIIKNTMQAEKKLFECGYNKYAFILGKRYLVGNECEKDINKAVEWFEKCSGQYATNEIDYASQELGEIYSAGAPGIPMDLQKALECYKMAKDWEKVKEIEKRIDELEDWQPYEFVLE